MKYIGLAFVIIGFIWAIKEVGVTFTSYQHSSWIWRSQNLPAGDMIRRDEAITAMREISLDLNRQQRSVLYPMTAMLLGSLMIFAAKRTHKKIPQVEQAAT
jgi:hypothetical protein